MSWLTDAASYLAAHPREVLGWAAWHLGLSVVPVLLGLVVALPLGLLTHRHRRGGVLVLGTAAALYTVPSLALFVLLPGLLGTKIFDPLNVVVALTLYSVALLVRVVVDGLETVPRDVVDAATALGHGPLHRFARIELPLAVPVIVQGLRVVIVSNVSIVPVASLLGIGQLGQLFTLGFQLFSLGPVVLGIIGCLALAVGLDGLVVLIGRLLTPWRRAEGAA